MQIMHAEGRFLHSLTLFIYSAPICQFMPCCGALCTAESIEWFIEDQAFLQSNDSSPAWPTFYHSPLSRHQAVSLSQSSFVSPVKLTVGRWGEGVGGARSQISTPQESLALYKSFNIIWCMVYAAPFPNANLREHLFCTCTLIWARCTLPGVETAF